MPDIESISGERDHNVTRALESLLGQGVNTIGVGVIQAGSLVWTGYFGEQSPGVPASAETLFNVASITKTVTAETILRLAADRKLSLDESMASYWVDPDVADDPRHVDLTPRMALTHTSGFLNWRFFAPDGVLRFEQAPGTTYGYSGEGFDYVMRFAEQKLGKDFERLAREYVFEPAAMTGVSLSAREANFARIADRRDASGTFYGDYCRDRPRGWCREEGEYSAAADMVVTVEDYARFLISAMNGVGLDEAQIADRNHVHVDEGEDDTVVDCAAVPIEQCPESQGYGLGWEVLDFGDNQLIGHGGSDWSEVTLAYFYTRSRDGLIIFLNAPNRIALAAMTEALALLDPDSPMLGMYRRWLAASRATPAS